MESFALPGQLAVLLGQLATDRQQLLLLPRQSLAHPAVFLREPSANLLQGPLPHLGWHEHAELRAELFIGQSQLEGLSVRPGNLFARLVEGSPRPIHFFGPSLQRNAFPLEIGPIATMLPVEAPTRGIQLGLRLAALVEPPLAELFEVGLPFVEPGPSGAKAGFQLRGSGVQFRLFSIQVVVPHCQVVGQLDRLGAELLAHSRPFRGGGKIGERQAMDRSMALFHRPRVALLPRQGAQVSPVDTHVRRVAI